MKNRFAGAVTLNNAADTSGGGDWSASTLSLSFFDPEGLFNAGDIQIGDVVFLDTGSYEPGTISRYVVAGVSPVDLFNSDVSVTFDVNNDNTAPDLSYALGGVGLVTRNTAGTPLAILPPWSLFNIPEKIVAAAENYDRIFSLALAAGVAAIDGATSYVVGDKVTIGGTTFTANGAIAAGTPVALGTTGATWTPEIDPDKSWAGLYDVGTTYAADAVVCDANNDLFVSRAAGNVGNAVTDTQFWLPYITGTTAAPLASTSSVVVASVVVAVQGDTVFTLPSTPDPAKLSSASLNINGMTYGLASSKWSVATNQLTWGNSYALSTLDSVIFTYAT